MFMLWINPLLNICPWRLSGKITTTSSVSFAYVANNQQSLGCPLLLLAFRIHRKISYVQSILGFLKPLPIPDGLKKGKKRSSCLGMMIFVPSVVWHHLSFLVICCCCCCYCYAERVVIWAFPAPQPICSSPALTSLLHSMPITIYSFCDLIHTYSMLHHATRMAQIWLFQGACSVVWYGHKGVLHGRVKITQRWEASRETLE